jgi:hypothetical protein
MQVIKNAGPIGTYLAEHAHLTGSAAYGLPHPKDYDYFCDCDTYHRFLAETKQAGLTLKDGGSIGVGVYFQENGSTYNVFVVSEREIEALKIITETITRIYQAYPNAVATKHIRVLLFETLRALLKLCRT